MVLYCNRPSNFYGLVLQLAVDLLYSLLHRIQYVVVLGDTDDTTIYRDTKSHDTSIVEVTILFGIAIPQISRYYRDISNQNMNYVVIICVC